MYTVEEIKNKVKTGTWTKEDVARCVEELRQISDFTVYTEEIYYISYGIFAYNFREYAYPLIEICREAGVHMERSKEKSRLYLASVRFISLCALLHTEVTGKSFGDRYRNSRECIWSLWSRRRRITIRWYVSLPVRSFGLNA